MSEIRAKIVRALFGTNAIDVRSTYPSASPFSAKVKVADLIMSFVKLNDIKGDYLEFGTGRGDSFSANYISAKRKGIVGMHFYGFDSFLGLPEPKGIDRFPPFRKGFAAYSREAFERCVSRRGVNLQDVTLIEGFFADTLNEANKEKLPIRQCAVAWIDCDLYESAVHVLKFLTDYVRMGTVVVFDDWFCFAGDPTKGEQRACAEWLAKNPQIQLIEYAKYGIWGIAFICHVREGIR